MLDLRYVVDQFDEVRRRLGRRGPGVLAGLDAIGGLAAERRAAIAADEKLAQELNAQSAQMAKIADKKSPEFQAARERLRAVGDEKKQHEAKRTEVEAKIAEILQRLPNEPDASVPDGESETQNVVVRTWGEKRAMDFAPRDHHDIGTSLGILDFERAAKISGPRFTVLWR